MSIKLLEGKKGIITGALDETSIAWQTALKAKVAGAEFILTNAPVSIRMGKIKELAQQTSSDLIAADVTVDQDIQNLYDAAATKFGKIDFILHSIGMSLNVRKGRDYTNLSYESLLKTYDISAVSFHRMLQFAYQKEIMNQWGSIVALSYIAAQHVFPKYNDMTESKAMLESIARNFGYYFGKRDKVRVNTISQSPTITTAGSGIEGFNAMLRYAEAMSPLGNATAEECANFIVVLFSDLTRKITMQNLMHDGGFSSVGVSDEVLKSFNTQN